MSPSPSTIWKPPIDYYQTTFGCEVEHREVVERDGVEEALLKVADSYVQLLTPTARRLAGREVPRDQGRRAAPRRVPRRRLRRGARVGEGARLPCHRRAAAARQPGNDGRVRAPEDGVRHAHRARPGIAPLRAGVDRPHAGSVPVRIRSSPPAARRDRSADHRRWRGRGSGAEWWPHQPAALADRGN